MKDSKGIFEFNKTDFDGCYEITSRVLGDERGSFIKTIHKDAFAEFNLRTDFQEVYYSVSHQNVLRGLHFQLPPADHAKLVYCISGTVFDVCVDLRKGSGTYGKYHVCELSGDTHKMMYIPAGMAHGFYTLSDEAVMMYHVTSVYAAEHDMGIAWDSAGIPWPLKKGHEPVLSPRDKQFIRFEEFVSPF